ncbi:MAG TPA: hypothetical protein VLZ03_06005 [Thermodesulfobacteriota bacterium]|nr:hypothetical protein [Thermodesulfobacteriota bacterium]
MKKTEILVAAISAFSLIFVGQSFAQRGIRWKGGRGWGPESAYAGLYDPKTVDPVAGEVISVDRITPMKGTPYGVHLT